MWIPLRSKNEFANTSIKFSAEAPTDEGERAHAAAMNGLRNLAGGGVGKNRK